MPSKALSDVEGSLMSVARDDKYVDFSVDVVSWNEDNWRFRWRGSRAVKGNRL